MRRPAKTTHTLTHEQTWNMIYQRNKERQKAEEN